MEAVEIIEHLREQVLLVRANGEFLELSPSEKNIY